MCFRSMSCSVVLFLHALHLCRWGTRSSLVCLCKRPYSRVKDMMIHLQLKPLRPIDGNVVTGPRPPPTKQSTVGKGNDGPQYQD
ncbi:hypothetical protein F4805DRAFT_448078, partial [Annulohypoxylon moriforme]